VPFHRRWQQRHLPPFACFPELHAKAQPAMEAAVVAAVAVALPLPLALPGGVPAAMPWMAMMVAWPLLVLLAGLKKCVEALVSLPLGSPQLGQVTHEMCQSWEKCWVVDLEVAAVQATLALWMLLRAAGS